MTNKRKTSAAIIGLLDAIKAEGLQPVEEKKIIDEPQKVEPPSSTSIDITPTTVVEKRMDEQPIPYTIQKIPTEKIKLWHLANRLQDYINESSCEDLISSIQQVGQQIPVLLRPALKPDSYELICGARRFFVCKKLNIPVLAAVVALDDKEALLAMDAENRPRQDISPYERALDYKRWVDVGVYNSYADVCSAIGMKKSLFSQIISLADIDPLIVSAFGHPVNIKIRWGYVLSRLCKDPKRKKSMIELALSMKNKNISPADVYKRLVDGETTRKASERFSPIVLSNTNTKLMYSKKKELISIKIETFDKQFEDEINRLINTYKLKLIEKV